VRILGGVIVGALGVVALLRSFGKPPREGSLEICEGRRAMDARRHGRAFASTFALTLANPMTIASFAAVAASVGVGTHHGPTTDAVRFVAGVLVGSTAWWLTLSRLSSAVRTRVSSRGLAWVDRASGVLLLGFAGFAIVAAVG
jgi:threonine/homoserine/homoserine lactone efflux protein